MTYFIDTNIFLRVLVKDDEKQFTECILLLKAIKNNKIKAYTGTIVIAEIVWTLNSYYGFSKQRTIQATRSIVNLRGLKIIDDYNHLLALDLYEDHPIKYIDTLIASYSEIQNKQICIVSFDEDFDKLSVLRKTPNEVLESEKISISH